jgi:hypothetical protein
LQLVTEVFESVVQANGSFFDDLLRLTKSYPLKLEYLPGNHDLYLNTEFGAQARQRLQELLPLTRSGGRPFQTVLLDTQYGVLAKHGHEWDPTNRYSEGAVAIGDAVVIEVLLRLPMVVAEALKSSSRSTG